MSDKTLEYRFTQLKNILEDESYAPVKRQSALKVLLKFPNTKEEALAKLVEFADSEQVWAIEYIIKDLKDKESSSVEPGGIGLG
jgi:hypothetical protein